MVSNGCPVSGCMRDHESRFWEKVDKSGDCWVWTGALFKTGYGALNRHDRAMYAHRVSYEAVHGPIAAGLVIDHICHNRACVRPDHLRAVTQGGNVENHSGARKDNKLGVRGVYQLPSGNYFVQVYHRGVKVLAKAFPSLAEAESAAIEARNRFHTFNDADRQAA